MPAAFHEITSLVYGSAIDETDSKPTNLEGLVSYLNVLHRTIPEEPLIFYLPSLLSYATRLQDGWKNLKKTCQDLEPRRVSTKKFTLISTSTPEGRSSLLSASTFAAGSINIGVVCACRAGITHGSSYSRAVNAEL